MKLVLDDNILHRKTFFQNNPSEDSTPSTKDIVITKRLVEVGEIIAIDVLNHLICSLKDFQSNDKQDGNVTVVHPIFDFKGGNCSE